MAIQLPIHKDSQGSQAQEANEVVSSEHNDERPRASLTLRVGDLAKRTGKTVRALHLYEEHGLLAPAQRSSGGYRLYNRASELRVRWIDKLQQMGFSLTDIKQIVQDVENSRNAPRADSAPLGPRRGADGEPLVPRDLRHLR
jgi:DNA-binding transcriptional MerR regulator